MEFVIKEYIDYSEEEILKLYERVGWSNYVNNPAMVKDAYANSLKILGAYENNVLLGIIRVVGDGHSIVFIQDIVVLPEYQRHGIGSALLKRILKMYQNVYQKTLFTDDTEKSIAFYKSVGFMMDTDIGCRAFTKIY